MSRTTRSRLGGRLYLLLWDAVAVVRALRQRRTARRIAPAMPDTRYGDPELYRRHVLKELLPFWATHGPDHVHGGFVQHLDRRGAVIDPTGEKSSAMQARFVYAFSAGYRLGGDQQHLDLARHALTFLMEHLWDGSEGGWYQSVQPDGRAKNTTKPLFSQAYALVGVLGYYRATGDPSAAATIGRAWERLEQHGWDHAHGGYVERCGRRWEVLSDLKTSCVHLDLLGAAITTHELFGTPGDRDRVHRLASVAAHRLRDPGHGLLLEVYHRDWRYHPAHVSDRVQIGHVLKGARSLLEAADVTGDQEFASAAFALADAGLRHGWDRSHGGFYALVSRTGRLADASKLWWHQCEGLAALAHLAALSDAPRYHETFLRLAEFCLTHLYDPEHGEWFTSCTADGRVLDSTKGSRFKAAYHTVAACLDAGAWLARRARVPDGPGTPRVGRP